MFKVQSISTRDSNPHTSDSLTICSLPLDTDIHIMHGFGFGMSWYDYTISTYPSSASSRPQPHPSMDQPGESSLQHVFLDQAMLFLLFSNWISWLSHLGIAWLDGRNLDLSMVKGRVVDLISVRSVQISGTNLHRAREVMNGEMRGGGGKGARRDTRTPLIVS